MLSYRFPSKRRGRCCARLQRRSGAGGGVPRERRAWPAATRPRRGGKPTVAGRRTSRSGGAFAMRFVAATCAKGEQPSASTSTRRSGNGCYNCHLCTPSLNRRLLHPHRRLSQRRSRRRSLQVRRRSRCINRRVADSGTGIGLRLEDCKVPAPSRPCSSAVGARSPEPSHPSV